MTGSELDMLEQPFILNSIELQSCSGCVLFGAASGCMYVGVDEAGK